MKRLTQRLLYLNCMQLVTYNLLGHSLIIKLKYLEGKNYMSNKRNFNIDTIY